MRRQWVSLGAIACVLMTAMVARAQDDKKGKKRGQPRRVVVFSSAGNSNRLLTLKVVKDDLKLTDEQKDKLAAAFKKARQATKIEGGQRLPRAEALKKIRELQQKMKVAQEQLTKDIAALLNKEQKARLEQIIIQERGWAMLNNKNFLKKLKVTDEQQEKFGKLARESQEERQELIQKVRSREIKLAEFQVETAKLAKALQKAKSEVLTADQKAAFEKMKGKKIDLPKRRVLRPGLQLRKKAAKKRDDL